MIPRIIHYGIFGSWRMAPLNEMCVNSWKRVLPDYEIRLWTDINGPVHKKFFRDGIQKRPILASNYLKYWALSEYGGVFLDNDIEMLKPFDLSYGCFLGFQRDDILENSINTAVIGSEKGHEFPRRCMEALDRDNVNCWPVWTGCGLPQSELQKLGLSGLDKEQDLGSIHVYNKEAFYPWRWDHQPNRSLITDKTFCVHHWQGSWTK